MKQKIPGAVAVVIAIIAGVLVLMFGWRKVSGGPDADVTQETINRYQGMSNKTFGGGATSGGGPSQATHGAPPAGAPAGNPQ